MTMSKAATESHIGTISFANGCSRTSQGMDLSGGQASTSTSLTKAVVEEERAGPLCRRSTRVSALKAQEKIKLKDDITGMEPSTANEDKCRIEPEEYEIPLKKRKIADPAELNQMSHTFYIQQEPDGTVIEVDEETEISSINSEEGTMLKERYQEIMSKEPTAEQLRERNTMIKNLEADLRREESKLTLMRKIVSSQQIAKSLEAKKSGQNAALNNGGAYKPAVATPKNGATNNKASAGGQNVQMTQDAINLLLRLGLEQQKDFIIRANKTNPQVVPQLVQTIAKTNCATQAQLTQLVTAIQQAQQHEQKEKQAAKEAALLKEQQNQQSNVFAKSFANATPAQRAAQARQAFRMQADKQLTQIANPKNQPAEVSFIPNPNQPDFCSLVALDIIVQRILKDKAAYAEVTERPYECEECGTDFTPSWKAIGPPGDLHLYCEQCVRETQKKRNQKEHTAFLRKAFNKVSAQEKEFEKQIADGKLDAVVAAAAAQQQAAQAAAAASSSAGQSRQNGSNTPTHQKSSTPVPSKLSTPSSSTTTPQAKKTPSTSATNNVNLTQLQQAQMAMMMRNTPMMTMLAQMSSNPAMMQQMYNPMFMQMMMQMQSIQQQAQQSQSRSSQQSAGQTQNFAMSLLAQAAMQSASQSGGSGNANQMAPFGMNPQLFSNPQMLRQLQERMQQQLKGNLKK